ncbi:hypothetical protein FI667_g7438, partial [Globisporangium splendens]
MCRPQSLTRYTFCLRDENDLRLHCWGTMDGRAVDPRLHKCVLRRCGTYQLSEFVPRQWLNRLAVAAVTVSCWSTPAIQRTLSYRPRLELISCLVLDIALDFISSIGVPIALAMLFVPDYDPEITNFEASRWLDLVWYAHMTNEFKLLFVHDFGSRALFATTLLLGLDDVKMLASDPSIIIARPKLTKSDNQRVQWCPSHHTAPSPASRNMACLDPTAITTFALWLVILLIHLLSSAFYTAVAYVYHKLPTTLLSADLNAYQLTIDMKCLPGIVAFHAICATLHVLFFLEMTVQSVRQRTWHFHRCNNCLRATAASSPTTAQVPSSANSRKLQIAPFSTSLRQLSEATNSGKLVKIRDTSSYVWANPFGSTGLFGVKGKHFTLIFLCFVPRVWLNRVAVAVVTISCWSTPAIQQIFSHKPRLELILCLLFDVALDFVSSIGVPTVLGMLYYPDYDPHVTDFIESKWYDLVWYAHLTNEFQLLFIQSWYDLTSRALFAITLLLCLDDVKFLGSDSSIVITRPERMRAPGQRMKWNRRLEELAHFFLVVRGCVVLALHVEPVGGRCKFDCSVQVRPWHTSKTACAFLAIDCQQHDGMVGEVAEVEEIWADIEPKYLKMVSVTGCSELHIPPSIRTFSQLGGLYLYDLTLVEWSAEAALTKDSHSSIHHLAFVTVNMSTFGNGSVFPPGLSGLSDLPPNLDELWSQNINLILGANSFAKVPEVLLRMDLMRLILNYNPLAELPAGIFETSSLQWLQIVGLPMQESPANVNLNSALVGLDFSLTNVSSLLPWMLSPTFVNQVKVSGGGSPHCTQLQARQDAKSTQLAANFCAS